MTGACGAHNHSVRNGSAAHLYDPATRISAFGRKANIKDTIGGTKKPKAKARGYKDGSGGAFAKIVGLYEEPFPLVSIGQ